MIEIDCTRCPAGPRDCEGCIASLLWGDNVQLDDLSEESCGYVLAPEVRSAIEVLRSAGLVSEIEIVAVGAAA